MYLVVDTETHDLPRDWRAPLSDLSNWPRIIQAAWLEYDASGRETGRFSGLVRPEGFSISPGAQQIHGISTAEARKLGLPLLTVLGQLAEALARARLVIAHNIEFDATVISAEYLRAGQRDPLAKARKLCTMKQSAAYCDIPGKYGPKWPKLEELHHHLFARSLGAAHDALVDAEACARCFFELKRLGIPPFRSA